VTHFRDLPRILQERRGVVNLHLAVDIAPDSSKMKMLYKISDGYVQEKFYGIVLAKVVDLPGDVIEVATEVSNALHERNEARRSTKAFLAVARRRKLILSLREQLIQAKNGLLEGEELRHWLKRLQNELIVRMAAIDAEAAQVATEAEGSEGAGSLGAPTSTASK
jgi:DNA mismatch repair protein MSH4